MQRQEDAQGEHVVVQVEQDQVATLIARKALQERPPDGDPTNGLGASSR